MNVHYVTCRDCHREGSRHINLITITLTLDWEWLLNATLRPVYPLKGVAILKYRMQSGASVPIWTDMDKRKPFAPAGIRTP